VLRLSNVTWSSGLCCCESILITAVSSGVYRYQTRSRQQAESHYCVGGSLVTRLQSVWEVHRRNEVIDQQIVAITRRPQSHTSSRQTRHRCHTRGSLDLSDFWFSVDCLSVPDCDVIFLLLTSSTVLNVVEVGCELMSLLLPKSWRNSMLALFISYMCHDFMHGVKSQIYVKFQGLFQS